MENTDVFSSEESQAIVNALLVGYRNHIDDRIQKSNELRVSGAFAWTKGNFLDSALADSECFESWRKQKAGYSWEYLEFELQNEKYGDCLFILKGSKRLDSSYNTKNKSQYLSEYAKINRGTVEIIKKERGIVNGQSVQLELFPKEDSNSAFDDVFQTQYQSFFIIRYETDENSKFVKVEIVMPDEFGNLYLIQDLSRYISSSNVEFNDEQNVALFNLPEETMPMEEFNIIPKFDTSTEVSNN
ncbi:hypothetical protein SAMN05216470_1014 [Streptococcus equinus]|uniref:Uncharacterized protein n=1 Tax=Streptococcus equinus TaxID=1335 RepID=A0A239R9K3_STREI|nr:hypothetical protein [Streptococcus equinus]SNU07573.1 hypothetical protein SAMN05216470_1014 [Streptococcus equinus]